MKGKSKILLSVILIVAVLASIIGRIAVTENSSQLTENQRASYNTPEQLIDSYEIAEPIAIEGTNDALTVDAWFLLDEDGKCITNENSGELTNVTRSRGVYQRLEEGTMVKAFVKINISQQNARLKDAEIYIGKGDRNFDVNDTVEADGSLISEITDEFRRIKFVDGAITTGTIVEIPVSLSQNVVLTAENCNNFSRDNIINFKGTYVDANDNEVPFDKDVTMRVDWDSYNEIALLDMTNQLTSQEEGVTVDQFAVVNGKLVASLRVASQTKGPSDCYGIPRTAEYILSGFKIGDYSPEDVTVTSAVWGYGNQQVIGTTIAEDSENLGYVYNADTDKLTFKNTILNSFPGGEGNYAFWQDRHESIITVTWPAEALTYAKSSHPSITISGRTKELICVNPNIKHSDTKSLIDNVAAEDGLQWIGEQTASLVLNFDHFDGQLYSLNHTVDYQAKANSLMYYGGATGTIAGFWENYDITATIGGGVIGNLKLEKDYVDEKGFAEDAFYKNEDQTYKSMNNIIEYTGVFINDAVVEKLGEKGGITFYDAVSGNKLTLYNRDGESVGTKVVAKGEYFFSEPVEHVRAITSAVRNPGTFGFSYMVKINNEKLVNQVPDVNEFNKYTEIVSSATLYMKLKGKKNYLAGGYPKNTRGPYREGGNGFWVTPQESVKTNGSTKIKNWTLEMDAASDYSKWANYSRLTTFWNPKIRIEFPDHVESVQVDKIYAYDMKDNSKKYKVYDAQTGKTKIKVREDPTSGRKYIDIKLVGKYSKNTNIAADYTITVDSEGIVDEEIGSELMRTFLVTTYDGTHILQNLNAMPWGGTSDVDTYDWDKDGIYEEEKIPASFTTLNYTDPQGILTTVGASKDGTTVYNFVQKDGDMVIDNVLNLEKGTTDVTIIDSFRNFSNLGVSHVRLIGRIPYEGNKFTITGDDLGSEFSTTMKSPITYPAALDGHIKAIYYSTNETKTISDASTMEEFDGATGWNWTKAENVTDWSKIKAYKIEFVDDYVIPAKTSYDFTYEVNMPSVENQEYGAVAYTSNAAVFIVDGQYSDPTESSKVGIKIDTDTRVNMNLKKVKEGTSDAIEGTAKYELSRVDGNKITDSNGNLVDSIAYELKPNATIEGLYPETVYLLKETQAPTGYKKQDIKFKVSNNNLVILSDDDAKGTINVTSSAVDEESSLITIDGEVPDPADEKDYKVEYHYQKSAGSTEYEQKTTRPAVTRTGIIGNNVEVTNDDKESKDASYVLNTTKNNEWNDTLAEDKDTVLKLYFDLGKANYKVEYYYQTAAGSTSYQKKTTRPDQTREDTIGKEVSVTNDDKDPKDANYALSNTDQNVWTETVAADGSTVLKVYFDLGNVNYKVEYYYQKSAGSSDYEKKSSRPDQTRSGTIGQEVSVTDADKNPNDASFVLNTTKNTAWTKTIAADGSTVLQVYFDLGTANYKVEYYYQKSAGSSDYEKKSSRPDQTRNDTIGKEVSVTNDDKDPKDANYALSNTDQNVWTETVAADGSTVLKVYFDLGNTNYKVEYYYQKSAGSSDYEKKSSRPDQTRNGTIGQEVSVTDADKNPNDASYVLNTTKNTAWTKTVAADGSTVLQVYFDLGTANYKVEYYYQKSAGSSDYEKKSSRPDQTRNDTIGKSVSVTDADKNPNDASYILNTIRNSEWTKTVAADGSTVLQVYFDLGTANYKVEYYYQKSAGSSDYEKKSSRPDQTRNGTIGQEVSVTDADKNPNEASYVLNTTKNTAWTKTVAANGSTVLQVYFDLGVADYKVEYYYQKSAGSSDYEKKIYRLDQTRSGTIGQEVSVTNDDKNPYDASYVLNTTKNTAWTKTVAANGSTVLQVYFDLGTANYKVEYYYQKSAGSSDYEKKSSRPDQTREDTIGKEVSVTDADKNPNDASYVLNTTRNSEWTKTVAADGSTVLKVYFDLGNADYKVEYYYQKSAGSNEYERKANRPDQTREDTIGKSVSITNDDKDPKDASYELNTTKNSEWTKTVAANGSTVLRVYFDFGEANYRVEYYYQRAAGSTEYNQIATRPAQVREDTIGKSVSITNDDKDPHDTTYKLNTTMNTEWTKTVAADGSTILKVYYDVNEKEYKVEYYYQKEAGSNEYNQTATRPAQTRKDIIGREVSVTNTDKDPQDINYVLNEVKNNDWKDTLSATKDTVLKVYFDLAKTEYTVEYYYQTEPNKDEYNLEKTSTARETIVGSTIFVENSDKLPTLDGYKYVVNAHSLETIAKANIDPSKNVLKVYFDLDDVGYKVEFYYMNDNKQYPNTPFATVNRMALNKSQVTLSTPTQVNDFTVKVTDSKAENEDISRPKTDKNYVYDREARNITSATVKGDGSTVLKVYFKYIPVNYNVDTVLKDTGDTTLTRNQFTITRIDANSNANILWSKKAVSESVELNEKDLPISSYEYRIEENETTNEKYVNVLEGKYVSVNVKITDEGKPQIVSWNICNNDGTAVGSNDSVYSYVERPVITTKDGVDTIFVKVINPVRFTVEVKKVDSEGNAVGDTGIAINSGIVDSQNAIHRTEIETESKSGLQIEENGNITGETNESGVIKYEETWVNANTYKYEITETQTAGDQYVNVLEGYKIVVNVKVNADGTLEAVKNGNRNYTIVATEAGKTVTDDLYNYVKVAVTSNSLKAIIDNTGHVNVEVTNPVRFNMDLIKKDSTGKALNGAKFSVSRSRKEIFPTGNVTTDVEIEESPMDAGTYEYFIREQSATSDKYDNILENRYIKLVLKVDGDGQVDIVNQGNDDFKVFAENGQEVYDYDNVLKYIKVSTVEVNDVYTVNVEVTNPAKYQVDVTTATTAYDENANINTYFLDQTDVQVYRERTNQIYSGEPVKGVELTERPIEVGQYTYYFTQTSTKSNSFVNPLEGKYASVDVTVNEDGTLVVGDIHVYEGTPTSTNNIKLLENDSALDYIDVKAVNPQDGMSTLKILIIDPVRFTVELNKLDGEGKGVENTNITVNSSIINNQNAEFEDEIKETAQAKDGIDVTQDGDVAGTTNENGTIKYQETWVDANKSSEFYTYEITEDKAAGNQYVNVLAGYKVVVRVRVSPEGTLTLVDATGKAYNRNAEHAFVIVDANGNEASADVYKYVKINVENNSLSAIISDTAKLGVEITNPVRFHFDVSKKDTNGDYLPGTKFTITRSDKSTPVFEGEPTDNVEIEEDPIDAGIYTYTIKEDHSNTTVGNRYVNVLDNGSYIKLKVKVNGNGVIDILDNEDEKNDDYFEVYDRNGRKVEDDNVLRYISVKAHDDDNDGVYTLDVDVKNPVRYEIDIITLDTLNKFLNGVDVTLYKASGDTNNVLYSGNATDVNKIQEVEKLEVPADAGTYTYYVKENNAPSDRYVNILDGKYIEIKLTVAADGMLSVTSGLYEGELGKGERITEGSVFDYFSVDVDNSGSVSRLNVTIIDPVRFVVEVDKYDTEMSALTGTTFEIESPIIAEQEYEHDNERISGIKDDGISKNGTVVGITENALENSPDGAQIRARISYEETWVDANESGNYYTYYIKETKTSGAQYVNILEGYKIAIKVHVNADGSIELVETDGRNYEIVKDDASMPDVTEEMYRYVSISASNNKILATMNASVINPVRYNIAVYQTIYGAEQVKLRNIPMEIDSEFSGKTVLVTDENGFNSMEERAVWADEYEYKIFQLNEFGDIKVEDEFVNMLDDYYIGLTLKVHGDGTVKTISADGDETTVSYKLFKSVNGADYKEIDFKDTIVDDFVKVKVTTSDDNVCTVNIYVITPEKYNFNIEKTDLLLKSYQNKAEKYEAEMLSVNENALRNMNDVEFSVTVRDENGEIVLKDTLSGKDAKNDFDTINTKEQKTANVGGVDGMLKFDNILIEKTGTYTFEISEVTPEVEGLIYKDKSESIIVKMMIVVEDGKYVLKDMETTQAPRYTILDKTGLFGDQTQTVYVKVTNERITGEYDLDLNKVSKLTGLPLDGAVYKVTVEQEGMDEKVLYLAQDYLESTDLAVPYVGDVDQDIEGTSTTTIGPIRVDLPETYTIKIEEIKAPDTYTKLDDVIELTVTTAIEGEYDEAHYVLDTIELKEGNHDLISETHTEKSEENQKISLEIKNEFFDLALRQYVTKVNTTDITARKPEVVVTDDFANELVTTADYNQVKEPPQRAYANQEIIYTIEVFNEGLIDGYAEEIVEHLPVGLEFVDDEFNKEYGWVYDEASATVTTKILSKEASEDNLIPAYNMETREITSKTIQLKLRTAKDVKLKQLLTTIAEITDSLAEDRKETVDRDSYDLVTLPLEEELPEYAENQEDDDDYEKLIIEEFDLAPVKYTKSINGEAQNDRAPKLTLDPDRMDEYKDGVFNGFKYKPENEMPKVEQGDNVVFGLTVYNEGSVGSYAEEVTDYIEQGFVFVKDSEINKKYGWRMVDKDGNETDDVEKATAIVTDYLSKAKEKEEGANLLKALEVKDGKVFVDSRTIEVEFRIVEPIAKDRIITNKFVISKHIDDQGIIADDRDVDEKIPENIEKLYVKTFDLELTQVINSIEVRNTKTDEVEVMDSEDIRKMAKVDIAKSKLGVTDIKVEYLITVKNNGESAGYATEIKDYIPAGLTFDESDNNGWTVVGDNVVATNLLENELMQPGETKVVKLILRWNGAANVGEKENISEISKHTNSRRISDIKDIDSTPDNLVEGEDDMDSTILIISMKTGSADIAIVTLALGFMIVVSLGITVYNRKRANNA